MDAQRSIALAGACVAFLAVPNLGALFGEGEQTDGYDTVITPPDYAFAVWAPIFAGCAVSTVAQCLPAGRADPVSRRTGWPLAGAYALNAAWSVAAQRGRFALTPYLLPVATALTAVAHARLQQAPARSRGVAVTPVSTGLLLGWTALASAVNIVAARAEVRTPVATAGLVAVSAVVSGAVAGSRRGGLPVALASGWGLVTLALSRRRPRGVRLAAALSAAAVGAAAVGRRVQPAR
jgi:hypothetical protein